MRPFPTADRIRELFNYDRGSGLLTWKVSPAQRVKVGDVAGSVRKDGYLTVSIDGRACLVHRVCWVHFYGVPLTNKLDHRDTKRAHNAIDNLREASDFQNNGNVRRRKDNTTGYKGVGRTKDRWFARIRLRGKLCHLGTFGDPVSAHNAYMAAAEKHFGEFARAA